MNETMTVRLLSVKEVAELLNVSQALVYALLSAKRIRHERHGLRRGKILIPEDALLEYREGRTVEAAGKPKKPTRRYHPTNF